MPISKEAIARILATSAKLDRAWQDYIDAMQEEEEECDECPAMVCIRDHRDVIRDLERRIAELEKRPAQIVQQPYYTAPPNTSDPKPWWSQPQFTCSNR